MGAAVAIAARMLECTLDAAPGWNQLIDCLDEDPRVAAAKYESTRKKLVRIFRARGHAACEELADKVIDRVARQLGRGLVLWPGGSQGYFCRVAHFLSLEASREEARAKRALQQLRERGAEEEAVAEAGAGGEQELGALEARVHALSAEDRRLLLRYYEGEGQVRIENRRRLAAEHGMSLNTLRVRMFRLRAELERALETDSAHARSL